MASGDSEEPSLAPTPTNDSTCAVISKQRKAADHLSAGGLRLSRLSTKYYERLESDRERPKGGAALNGRIRAERTHGPAGQLRPWVGSTRRASARVALERIDGLNITTRFE